MIEEGKEPVPARTSEQGNASDASVRKADRGVAGGGVARDVASRAQRFLLRVGALIVAMGVVDVLVLAANPASRTPEGATNVTDLTAAALALVGLLNVVGARGTRLVDIAANERTGRASLPEHVRESFAKEDRALGFLVLCACAASGYFFLARESVSLIFN